MLKIFEVVTNDLDENKDDVAVLVAASDATIAAREAIAYGIDSPWAIFEIGAAAGDSAEEFVFLRGPYSCVAINRMNWINHVQE